MYYVHGRRKLRLDRGAIRIVHEVVVGGCITYMGVGSLMLDRVVIRIVHEVVVGGSRKFDVR